MTRPWCALGLALALVVPSTACGDDETTADRPTTDDAGDVAEEPEPSPDETTTSTVLDPTDVPDPAEDPDPATTSTEAPAGEPTPDRWATTPLDQYWGYSEIGSEAFWDEELEKDRAVEELVATCMAEHGFEYVPFLSPYHPAIVGESGMVPEGLSDDEYREQYGYGISTHVGEVHPAFTGEVVEDPNGRVREALGAAEREAYDRALFGDIRSITESTPEEERGCGGRAVHEVRGAEIALQDQLGEEQVQLSRRIENDPRMVQAELEWSRCMGTAGYVFATRDDIFSELAGRAEHYQMRGDPYEWLTQAEIDAIPPDELDAVVAELSALSPEEQAVLDELQVFELGVAAADHECGIPLDDVRYEVTVELEQEFVDEHLALLEAFVAARGS